MNSNTILLILACSATAHLVVSATTAIYARHKVQYLCLAWVNGIFGFLLAAVASISDLIATGEPGIMHPAMILPLLCGVYLQSIFPLSIPMPGFLQAKRMIKYARPVIALIAVYSIARLMGSHIIIMHNFQEVFQNLLSVMSSYESLPLESVFITSPTSSCFLSEWFIRQITQVT